MQGSKIDMNVKNGLFNSVGESEDGMIWENSIETYILSYVKHMNSASSMHDAGDPKPVPWDTQRDGVRRELGGVSGWGDTCVPVADSCQCMARAITVLLSNYPPIKIN